MAVGSSAVIGSPVIGAVRETFARSEDFSFWTQSRRWMFGRICGLDGRESYRELRLKPLCCPHRLSRGTAPHERAYPPRKDRFCLQDRVTELIEQQTAISEVLRAIARTPHDCQPIFDAILGSATRVCQADIG